MSNLEAFSLKDEINIPEGYNAVSGQILVTATKDNRNLNTGISATIGGQTYRVTASGLTILDSGIKTFPIVFNQTLPVSITFSNYFSGSANFNIEVKLSDEAQNAWRQQTFNKIISAYETALEVYNSKVAEENAKAENIKGSNPLFYRQIEQEVLKHNCIAYLTKSGDLGKLMYSGTKISDFQVNRTGLDQYLSLAKFMEQAFEWNIMDYNLYPYYWADKNEWQDIYYSEEIDPIFRSFLRSGMARVVVTVRPGFEDAVQFYMSTGRLWNGGEVPVISDPMYLSIVDEMKDTKGEPQGKPWITRLPTPLTILQAESIGLKVAHALPFTDEDPQVFENPEEVITESNFEETDALMEVEKSRQIENIEINNDYLQLTTDDDPHQIVAQISIDDQEALE
ncbi:MAG: hypothetical protein LBE36_02270 [Flavobacteriaceae bacterium]|jgi:hypothetical protein|nr:hypothetical protein [Flavobacteriaceae bacterium]